MQSSVRGGAALASDQDEQANERSRMKCERPDPVVFSELSSFESEGHIPLSGMAPLQALEPTNLKNQLARHHSTRPSNQTPPYFSVSCLREHLC
jgi:hypothetical protein